MRREIKSVEVSLFVHATEDESRVKDSIKRCLQTTQDPSRERLEGHYGNEIIRLRYHITGEEAWSVFRSTLAMMGEEERRSLLENLHSMVDEHSALYLRLDKQELLKGELRFSSSDPVRVRVKPMPHAAKGRATSFYTKLLELKQ